MVHEGAAQMGIDKRTVRRNDKSNGLQSCAVQASSSVGKIQTLFEKQINTVLKKYQYIDTERANDAGNAEWVHI